MVFGRKRNGETRWRDCEIVGGLEGAYIRFCETNPPEGDFRGVWLLKGYILVAFSTRWRGTNLFAASAKATAVLGSREMLGITGRDACATIAGTVELRSDFQGCS